MNQQDISHFVDRFKVYLANKYGLTHSDVNLTDEQIVDFYIDNLGWKQAVDRIGEKYNLRPIAGPEAFSANNSEE